MCSSSLKLMCRAIYAKFTVSVITCYQYSHIKRKALPSINNNKKKIDKR